MQSDQQIQNNQSKRRITWYRSPLDRETFNALNQRSNWKGLLQALGHLGLVVLTGAAAWYAAGHLPLPLFLIILFLHGTCYAFINNGSHELCHYTVFKSKSLNTLFLKIFSFLVWRNYFLFVASHTRHHRYTLHPPDDLEVELPIEVTLKDFLKNALVTPWSFYDTLKKIIRLSFGKLVGEWENSLFPPSAVEKRRHLFNWARILLVGHVLIVVVSIYFGLWLLPVLTTFAPAYGGWLRYLCNNTQHTGLQDNVPDFRLCCRTVMLSPFVRFLYWHMNYHIEHHMYAAVPCYNLGKLHNLIKDDLQECPRGLLEAWKEIIGILKKQKVDPKYQYVPQLPIHST